VETGYFGRFNASPVAGGEDEITMGLYMVKVTLVFDFSTRGVGNKDGKGVSLRIYEGGFVISDSYSLEVGEPIICVFLAIGIDKLRCDTRD
jgi:hypothetical protein